MTSQNYQKDLHTLFSFVCKRINVWKPCLKVEGIFFFLNKLPPFGKYVKKSEQQNMKGFHK